MDNKADGFGPWVRERRAKIGLTLRRFAQHSRLDPGNLSRYERGVVPPPQEPETLERIATALNLQKETADYREFMDLAHASAGRIPPDLIANPDILAKMPLLFRSARDPNVTKQRLLELAERLKST